MPFTVWQSIDGAGSAQSFQLQCNLTAIGTAQTVDELDEMLGPTREGFVDAGVIG